MRNWIKPLSAFAIASAFLALPMSHLVQEAVDPELKSVTGHNGEIVRRTRLLVHWSDGRSTRGVLSRVGTDGVKSGVPKRLLFRAPRYVFAG